MLKTQVINISKPRSCILCGAKMPRGNTVIKATARTHGILTESIMHIKCYEQHVEYLNDINEEK